MRFSRLEVRQSGPVVERGPDRGEGSHLRVAHLTDLHVGAVHSSVDGFAAALESLGSLNPLPDCLVLGGDMVEDGFGSDHDNLNDLSNLAETQWSLFDGVLQAGRPRKDGAFIPIYPILGNHDVLGWGLPGPLLAVREAKAKALSHLGQFSPHLASGRTYYSVEHNGWRLIFLDSIHGRGPDFTSGGSYYGGFDDGLPVGGQSAWLESELSVTGQHFAVFSHIPVLSSTPLFWNDYPDIPIDFFGNSFPRPNSFWIVQDHTIMHFMKSLVGQLAVAGVRLCASGHTHMLDSLTHRGVLFACSAAVSGNYWKGPCVDSTNNGYAIFDLWDNGWVESSYHSFGW